MPRTPEPRKRMAKSERRTQLLDTALEIAREEGTDALTLGHLAERAGVSKPIAYAHFGTRSQLLIATCRRLDERQVALLHEALARAPRRLADVAKVVSTSYMHCYATVGAEWHALIGALQGDEEMNAYQREVMAQYVAIFREALTPFSRATDGALRLRCVGIVGAAEAISRDMLAGEVSERTAASSLATLVVAAVSAP